MTGSHKKGRGEVLIAILKDKSDFSILQDKGWYRIPLKYKPRRWPPRWLAFYQPKAFGDDAYRIRYYGEVGDIQVARRSELFPDEFPNPKSDQEYYRITLTEIAERDEPIYSIRPRRLVFIPTTWSKFSSAELINDLFDDSPLEDRLWNEFKKLRINAERQWWFSSAPSYYALDFALFCNKGLIDIETDGDTWHSQRERIPMDNQRDNDLTSSGWNVLRFNGRQINQEMSTYCLKNIQQTINKLDGLNDEGLVPRKFFTSPSGTGQQLSLFEKPEWKYMIEEPHPFDID